MMTIEIFDPAMCCSTGVCGPSVDPELLRVATVLDALHNMGIDIPRHNLSADPKAYLDNAVVNRLLHEKGADALPITLVDGELAVSGSYPTTAQLGEWTGKDLSYVPGKQTESCCCGESVKENSCCGENKPEGKSGCSCGGCC